MLFNSFDFLIFSIVTFGVYYWMTHKWQNRFLLILSYIFYGFWNWKFLSLIALSTIVDYFVGLQVYRAKSHHKEKLAKFYLLKSMIFNLSLLGIFKYYNFFVDSLDILLRQFGIELGVNRLSIILPVGISFYTFQTMSYTIDIYRGELKPTKKFIDFALFVSFFPQLVAGPIERASRLLPQVLKKRTIDEKMIKKGLWLILIGYFKKVFIADNCAPIADAVFTSYQSLTGLECIVGILAFTFQIYGDFSGYSDIARGLSKLLGFDLMVNFKAPYFSKSPAEFWRRWHISLSTWLRDYLYISLGGNRKGPVKTYRNLLTTMVLGGLWHGASWTFIAWGFYQGSMLVIHRFTTSRINIFKPFDQVSITLGNAVRMIISFCFTCYGWLIFRAESMEQLTGITKKIFSDFSPGVSSAFWLKQIIYFNAMMIFLQVLKSRKHNLYAALHLKQWQQALIIIYLLTSVFLLGRYEQQEFIYFQF